MTIGKILYCVVMHEESSHLLKDGFVQDTSVEFSNVLEAYVKKTESGDVIIIRPKNDPLHNTGLFGTEIAFFITYIGIKHYNPDVVISMGYAGDTGVGEKLKLGSICIAEEKSIYHRREMIIKFFENTSHGHYPVMSCPNLCKELNYVNAKVGTSNSFVDHDKIAHAKNIKVVEMELCSVARACSYFNTPCIGVKIISDSGDETVSEEEREKQFLKSLVILQKSFYYSFENLNTYLFGKKVDEL
jgi:hypothetical protein